MKTGVEMRYRLCGLTALAHADNLLLCWLSSTFWRTLGLFANIFSGLPHPSTGLSAGFGQTLGFRQTFFSAF
jgi:hypothetical protein